MSAATDSGPSVAGAEEVVHFPVRGMSCAACAARIEKVLRRAPGVLSAGVSFGTHEATVRLDPRSIDSAEVIRLVIEAGFQVPEAAGTPLETSAQDPESGAGLAVLRRRFVVALVCSVPLMLIAMSHREFPNSGLIQFLLATPVMIYSARPFYTGAWAALRHGGSDMNSLIALGISASYGFSVAQLSGPHGTHHGSGIYFEAAAVIVTLVLLGRVLEARARNRTGDAIRRLIGLHPVSARVVVGERELDVPVTALRVGDVLRVRPGERLPADGMLTEGAGGVDESLLTGESLPVWKTPGDAVHAGTLNGASSLLIRATRVGPDSTLSRIIRLVREAQGSKAPVQKLADRVAAVFVPAVLCIAALTLVAWLALDSGPQRLNHAVSAAVSVLVIACPCALGLATPTAIIVGVGRGSELGVLIRDGQALEHLARLDTVVFDKTGTLTLGRPEVVRIEPVDGWGEDELLATLAAAEAGSEHPLASAITAEAGRRALRLPPAGSQVAVSGRGLQAIVDGRPVLAGTLGYLAAEGVDVSPVEATTGRMSEEALTAIAVAVAGRAAGTVAVADRLREESREVVGSLERMGLRTVMLTGDQAGVAAAVARQAGLREFRAGLLPGDKTAAVRDLQQQGRRVGMVGDGINDAPALAAADVGIAMGTGVDVAMETAGVTLLRGDLHALVTAVRLARATMAAIRRNLFFAFAYNVVGIPVAAGLLYPWTGLLLSPMIASAAMALSSVSVVTSSLRLKSQRL